MYSKNYLQQIEDVARTRINHDILCNKTILITGATGLLCSSVVDIILALNRVQKTNIKIIIAGRSEAKFKSFFGQRDPLNKLSFVHFDAVSSEDFASNDDIDYIIYGASNATPSEFTLHPVETLLANVLGLNKILKAATSSSVERVLYVSSSEVYGSKNHSDPYLETDYGTIDILNPRAPYPISKKAGESLCISYGAEHFLNTVIVRPGHIYGPLVNRTDNRASAQFARKAKTGSDITLKSDGQQLRSYCHSLDCASALLTVLISGRKDNAYNISNPHSICTVAELADTTARIGGVSVEFASPTKKEKHVFNMMDNSSLDSTKLEALGWTPYFNLEDGITNMLNEFIEI